MAPQRDDETQGGDEATQEQVSRLLAAAAGPSAPSMPEDVASRLDDVLAGLVQERRTDPADEVPDDRDDPVGPDEANSPDDPDSPDQTSGVTALASRRSPRGPRLLLAAAAVSVLVLGAGVGIGELAGSGGGAGSSGAAGGASQSQAAPGADSRAQEHGPPSSAGETTAPLTGGQAAALGRPPRVRSGSLRADLQRIEDARLAVPAGAVPRQWRKACVRPATAAGDAWLRVRLDGRPAVLVLRAPDHGRRTAEVFACGAAETPVASSTVVAR